MGVRTSIVGLLVALTAAGGCGEEGTTTTESRVPATTERAAPTAGGDRAIAAAALLALADLPSQWEGGKRSVTDFRCASRPFRGARTAAGRFRFHDTAVNETVAIFRTDGASSRGYARLNARSGMRCLRRNARERMNETVGSPASRPEVIRVDRVGPTERAIRLVSHAPTQIGDTTGFIDAVHARVGRGVGAIAIISAPGPAEVTLYEDVVAALKRRLRDALG